MIKAGFENTDPRNQSQFKVIKGAEETGGRGWVIEVLCPEGTGPSILTHLHETWTESFEILQGMASYTLDGKERSLEEGESVVVPPGVTHDHPWNTGSGILLYRQTNDFGATTPEAVTDVLGVFATMNGLAREGRLGKNGLPKNPLQLAATMRILTKHGSYDATVPIPIQKVLSATLGRIAAGLGYRGVYERFLR